MSKLAIIDDNPLDHFILQKILDDQHLFPDRIHLSDAGKLMDVLTKWLDAPSECPDIVLLDLNMPQFSGWDILQAMEKVYPLFSKEIVVYILTSSIDAGDKAMSRSFPFVKDFLTKPIERQALRHIYELYAA